MRNYTVLNLVALAVAIGPVANRLFAAEPKQTVEVLVDAEAFSSVADDLNIKTRSGTIELSLPASNVRAEVEFYKDGKRLERQLNAASVALSTNGVPEKFKKFQFAIHIVDLDFLKLGDGQAQHNRWRLKFGTGGQSATAQTDIPKTEFDVAQEYAVGTLGGQQRIEGRENRFPICYFIGRAMDNKTVGGRTAKEIIANNPKSEIAILYVVVE